MPHLLNKNTDEENFNKNQQRINLNPLIDMSLKNI